MRALTPLEARALGVLAEKQHTVPDTYPLSLNTLLAGCNQKTSREPIIDASEAEVLTALDGLRSLSLVFEGGGGRVMRYEHNLARVLRIPGQSVALLTLLMLRGPQTSSELRQRTERLHRFADVSSVEGFLDELAEREPALVLKLPRAPGSREPRWAHLLCGEVLIQPSFATAVSTDDSDVSAGELAALKREQARIADEVAALRALVQRIATELGIGVD